MTASLATNAATRTEVRDFVCTACGCACDDLTLNVDADRIVALAPPCPLAEEMLLAERPAVHDADSVVSAVEQTAALLRAARSPLVMGFERATVEAQRIAVEIADRLGGFLDPTDDRGASQSHAAVQAVGAITATLGEVAQRSDLIVYWECDPATTHPRHMDRFALRPGRRVVAVANWPTPTAALADEYLLIPASSGFECLWTLRALLRGVALDAEQVEQQTGNPLTAWQRLADQLKATKYAAIFHDSASRGVPAAGASDSSSEAKRQAIVGLVRELHRHTRAVELSLGAAPNAVGAAQVLTWQTGFPASVSFARGYPEHLPGEAMAMRLAARREIDAALVIAADPLAHWPQAAADYLRSIPTVVLDDRETATMQAATVAIRTAPFDIATEGDVFRSDGVALPLRAAVRSTLPTTDEGLAQLSAALVAQPASSSTSA
jgi:formylmethanofuran dehydrogenase subunit B